MILAYGPYIHSPYECSFTIQRNPLKSDRGEIYGFTERWDIMGELQATSSSQLEYKIAALREAYSTHGWDLRLYRTNAAGTGVGTAVFGHGLISALSRGGTRVVSGPNHSKGEGAELGTFRTYSVAVEADFEDPRASNLYSFWEELEFVGNGQGMFAHTPVLHGPWPRQQTSTHSLFRVIQSGEAVGLYTYPAEFVPGSLWPINHQGWDSKVKRGRPKSYNGSLREFPISWSYSHEANVAMVGNPHAY